MSHPHSMKQQPSKSKKESRNLEHEELKDGTLWSTIYEHKPIPKVPYSSTNNKPFKVVQTIYQDSLVTTSTSTPTTMNIIITAASLDQASTFASLFDQYRINKLEIWISPKYSAQNVNTSSAYLSVIDYDDSTALSSFNAGLDYQNCVTSGIQQSQYRCFTPHIAVAGYTGSFGGFTNMTAPWIDWSSTSVVHYGLKCIFNQSSSTGIPIDVTYRVHFENRNLR
jgi:hypothetical protein